MSASDQVTEVGVKYLAEMAREEVPVGYKQTEVGVIPEDWDTKCLGEICNLKSGLGITAKDIDEVGQHPCFGGNGLRGFTKNFTHDGKYALIGRQGALCGNVQYVSGKFYASEHALVATPFKDINPKWIAIYLQRMNLNQYSESSAQPGLSDVDALINELEKLITKKQAIKTATMQQLLTGRTRLPQFALREDGTKKGYKQSELGEIPEDWDVASLGQIGQTLIGLTYSPNDVTDFGTLVLRSSNVQGNRLAYDDNVYVNMELPDRVIVKKGDILICVRNGSRQLIGKCALIDADGSAFGAFMSIFRTHYYDFVFYQFQSNIIQTQINEIMGATINQITNKDMAGFKISLPSQSEEQTAIATILSDMDTEIQTLQQRLSKTRQIKQGMMQELLTGKTRLIQRKLGR